MAQIGESRRAYRVLVGKPEGRRPLGRRGLRWEDNIKMDIIEVGFEARILSIWLKIGTANGSCECGNEPSGSMKCGEFLQ